MDRPAAALAQQVPERAIHERVDHFDDLSYAERKVPDMSQQHIEPDLIESGMIENQLSFVHQTVDNMLDERDPVLRIRVGARALYELGWGHVGLSILDRQLTIVEPPLDETEFNLACQLHAAAEVCWYDHLTRESESGLERYHLGGGYFFPGVDRIQNPLVWQPGDTLVIALSRSYDRLASWISLDKPKDHYRPTLEKMYLAGIIAAQIRAAIENNGLSQDLTIISEELQNQIEELVMLQRVDEELSSTLNIENVMMLTMDWALRRTGATAGRLNIVSADGTTLSPVAALGYPLDILASTTTTSALPMNHSIVGRAAQSREIQITKRDQGDPDYSPLLKTTQAEIAIPMEMHGRLLGVLNLESDYPDAFDNIDLSFFRRLSGRSVIALDNSRLYRESERRADEMAALYSSSRMISSSLERGEILVNASQAFAAVLSVSGIILTDYQGDRRLLTVSAAYRLGTARDAADILPALGESFHVKTLPEFETALQRRRALTVQVSDPKMSPALHQLMVEREFRALLITPLMILDQILGMVLIVEGRRERQFTPDEILLAESLASQTAAALRQARLYEDVRELEKLKSEMIRMASHDLRNPLNNAMGYLELLIMTLSGSLNDHQMDFVENIRRSTTSMKSLIEDLLTLEHIESDRKTSWHDIDLWQLTFDVVAAEQPTADLKHHALNLHMDDGPMIVHGHTTQLRQAMTNLISNGIKYTPDNGVIEVNLCPRDDGFAFEVEDNGYGISPERQTRLFERFYRAREPSTDHIQGTGLGLSLVKTVVERHGGHVWVKSEVGVGSTFGFWLPAAPVTSEESTPEAGA